MPRPRKIRKLKADRFIIGMEKDGMLTMFNHPTIFNDPSLALKAIEAKAREHGRDFYLFKIVAKAGPVTPLVAITEYE